MKISTIIFSQRVALAVGIFLVLFGLFGGSCGVAHASPKEPPISELHRWYASEDGTVIIEYRIIDKYGVQLWRFKHALKTTAEKAPACNEVIVNGDEVLLLTQESNPSRYLIKKESDGHAPEFSLDFTYDLW